MKKFTQKVSNIIKQAFAKRPILMKVIVVLFAVLLLNQSVALFTKVNVIEIGIKKLLASVDIYFEEVKEVELSSEGWESEEPGSWKINKKAEWTGVDTAEIKIMLDTQEKVDISNEHVIRDVILVIDTSLSMENDGKMAKVKEQASKLVDDFLKDEQNNMALVEFNDTAKELSYFTNEKDSLKNSIAALTPTGNTNYNDALNKVGNILEKYDTDKTKPSKSVLVLFLTDGVPCVDTPNEVGTYNLLKSTYSYIHIKGIQYEMGDRITDYLKSISDSQSIATKETLGEVFFGATIVTEEYKKFIVTDYIKSNYFHVASQDDITVGQGTVELQEENGAQKVVWNLGDNLASGTGYSTTESHDLYISIKLTLNEEYANDNDKDYYPTNSKLNVTSQLADEAEKNKEFSTTPVLKRIYTITYDTNPPKGCESIKKISTENHYALGKVEKSQDKLTCSGYLFKGWKIADENVTSINDDIFIMPTHDITIRGTWAKIQIAKTVGGGSIRRKINLYDQVKFDAQNKFGAEIYTGPVTDTYNNTLENQEIYYYTLPDKNNIIFGGFCWQMVRTTATGGVKIIYNGVPTEEGQCYNTGETQTIGKSRFNQGANYLSYVGYMHNIDYIDHVIYYDKMMDDTLYGSDVTWDGNKYTLVDPQTAITDERHYSCNNSTGTCEKVNYYYLGNLINYYVYIELSDGKKIEDAIYDMIGYSTKNEINDNLNKTDSSIKAVVDEWYKTNIDDKELTQYVDDVVYCNNRSVSTFGGWAPNGVFTKGLDFKEVKDHTCTNLTDQFSTQNPHAQLKYPVGLLTYSERVRMDKSLYDIGSDFFAMTPVSKGYYTLVRGSAHSTWGADLAMSSDNIGVRPVIALKKGAQYKDGNGTSSSPYIVFYE